MSKLTLAISYITTCNLPWFMGLTFQVPMQYCSLQHRTSLPSPVTPTTGRCFCFGSVSSFFLELFLHSSPVAYWAPTGLGSSSFSVLATRDQWRNNSRKNEEMEPKQKQYPVVYITGDGNKVQCCKEQYCIGTWNDRPMANWKWSNKKWQEWTSTF